MTTPDRWTRARDLFHHALGLPEAERDDWLAREAGDAALAAEVRSLLRASLDADDWFEPRTTAREEPAEADILPFPECIEGFRILGLLGYGGMGVVYRARQESPDREVALKVLRPGVATPASLRRFEREIDILGRLEHPAIARIFAAGRTGPELGRNPYFVMELVTGSPVTKDAARRGLDLRERVRLVARICDAVHYAHSKGIIHRDLKPANILVDGAGEPHILDFGVARCLDAQAKGSSERTGAGQLVGTLPYMSPEQVAAGDAQVDTRTDVYALGALLYELLAGRPAYDLSELSMIEAMRVLASEEPVPLHRHARALAGDLSAITAKAMEKDPARRYASAAELAADLRAWLEDRPVRAAPPDGWTSFRKWCRRRQAAAAAIAAATLALLAGTATTAWQALRAQDATRLAVSHLEAAKREAEVSESRRIQAESARQDAEAAGQEARRAAARAEGVVDFYERMIRLANPSDARRNGLTVVEALDQTASLIEGAAELDPSVRAAIELAVGSTYHSLERDDEALLHLQRSLELARIHEGERSAVAAYALQDLAILHADNRAWDEAEGPARAALAVFEVDPKLADHAANMQAVLGLVLAGKGRKDEGEAMMRRSLERLDAIGGAEKEFVPSIQNALGVMLWERGALAEAEPLLRDALRRQRETEGPRSLRYAHQLANLGLLLVDKPDLAEAAQCFDRAAACASLVGGEDHRLVDWFRMLQGHALAKAERLEEALPLLEASYRALREAPPRDDLVCARAIWSLGAALNEVRRPADAVAPLRDAVERFGRKRGGRDAETISARYELCRALMQTRDAAAAEPHLREVLAALAERDPPVAVQVAAAEGLLGICLNWLGRGVEAEPLLRRAHAVVVRELGADAEMAGHLSKELDALATGSDGR